jgi:transposase InsO family protein
MVNGVRSSCEALATKRRCPSKALARRSSQPARLAAAHPDPAGRQEQVGELPEQVNVNLDRGYDSGKTRTALAELGFTGEIARKGVPAPVQAGKRWWSNAATRG